MIEQEVFRKARPDLDKLKAYGFVETGCTESGLKEYVYETDFMDGDFHAIITVSADKKVFGKVIDMMTEEEYIPLRAAGQNGPFVSRVRYEYQKLLEGIAEKCTIPMPFESDQANRIAAAITERYGDEPDFPWDGPTDGDYAVFRDKGNQKWYGLMMYQKESVLKTPEEKAEEKRQKEEEKKRKAEEKRIREELKKAGKKVPRAKKKSADISRTESQNTESQNTEGQTAVVLNADSMTTEREVRKINIMNLKISPEDGEMLWTEKGIYPSYHMSQKSWISVRVDDTLSDERILQLIEDSHRLVVKKHGVRPRSEGPKKWIVPANPKVYDLITVFSESDDTDWKQGKGIETGDIIYMYTAVPYSAILYKCTVTKAHSGYEGSIELMDIHIDERYEAGVFTLNKMKEFGVTTVRGPRFMPEELAEYIERVGRQDT